MGKLLRGFFFFGLALTMGCGDSQEKTRQAGGATESDDNKWK